ncbi:MAG: Holliday junction resolvase RuvX [Schleiferiaceae bacterium]|nr:Holliday junction resolvase RuvX [Schleiferiaceae bacterium]
MGIWLGLDVGAVRTGLAESDPLHSMAFPVGCHRTTEIIAHLTRTYPIQNLAGIVIGLPKDLQGRETEGSSHARELAEKIQALWSDVSIHWVDERYTSKIAAQAAHQAGAKARVKKDKGMLDAAAASLILDSFLTQKNRS